MLTKIIRRLVSNFNTNIATYPANYLPDSPEERIYFREATGITKPNPEPQYKNYENLKDGYVQYLRVNNPYRYNSRDAQGFNNYSPKNDYVGVYKDFEIGGGHVLHSAEGEAFSLQSPFLNHAYRNRKRTVRIYRYGHSHMQDSTLTILSHKRGGEWVIEFENFGYYRTRTAGGNAPVDGQNKRRVYGFKSRENAVRHAEHYGYAIDVEVPHDRYLARKSYADNFKWKGKPKESDKAKWKW